MSADARFTYIGGPTVLLGRVDAVLLSHDHHFDNLDAGGRAFLAGAADLLTTEAGAERLGGRWLPRGVESDGESQESARAIT